MELSKGQGGSTVEQAAKQKKLPALLVPAGGQEQLETALLYGANAVYLGGDSLNLRAGSQGFTGEALDKALLLAHQAGVQVFYCLNALPYNDQLAAVRERLEAFADAAQLAKPVPDAFIIADPGVLHMARTICPSIPVHLSTQAHSVNSAAVNFWQSCGVSRVNLARELNYHGIATMITACPGMEFEVFAHGAMCLALSGHCLMSAWLNKRPANHGRCTQPCRFAYRRFPLEEELRPGNALWEVEPGQPFDTIWAPEDLCLLRYVPWMAHVGVHTLKLEGRTRSGGALAPVIDVYRTALDRVQNTAPPLPGPSALLAELGYSAARPLGSGFFLPKRRREVHVEAGAKNSKPIVGRIVEIVSSGTLRVQVRSQWRAEEGVELLLPGMQRPQGACFMENHRGEGCEVLHSGMEGLVHIPDMELQQIPVGAYVRAAHKHT